MHQAYSAVSLIVVLLSRAVFAQSEFGNCYETPANLPTNVQYTVSQGTERVTFSFVLTPPPGTTSFAVRLNNAFVNDPQWILASVPQGEFQSASTDLGGPQFVWPVNGTRSQSFSITVPGGAAYGNPYPSLTDLCQQGVIGTTRNGSVVYTEPAYRDGNAGSCVLFLGSNSGCSVATVGDKEGYRAQILPTAFLTPSPNGAPAVSPNSFNVYSGGLGPGPSEDVFYPPQQSQTPQPPNSSPPQPVASPTPTSVTPSTVPPSPAIPPPESAPPPPLESPSQTVIGAVPAQPPQGPQVSAQPPSTNISSGVPVPPVNATSPPSISPSQPGVTETPQPPQTATVLPGISPTPSATSQSPGVSTTPSPTPSGVTGTPQPPQTAIVLPGISPTSNATTISPAVSTTPSPTIAVPPTNPPEFQAFSETTETTGQGAPPPQTSSPSPPSPLLPPESAQTPSQSVSSVTTTVPTPTPLPETGNPPTAVSGAPVTNTPSPGAPGSLVSSPVPTQSPTSLGPGQTASPPVPEQATPVPTTSSGGITPSGSGVVAAGPAGTGSTTPLPQGTQASTTGPPSTSVASPQPTPTGGTVADSGSPTPTAVSGTTSGAASVPSSGDQPPQPTPPGQTVGSPVTPSPPTQGGNPPPGPSSGACQVFYGISTNWNANGESLSSLNLYIQNSGTQATQPPLTVSFVNPSWTDFRSPWNLQVTSFSQGTVNAVIDPSATGGNPLMANNANTANVGGIPVTTNGSPPQGPTSLTLNGVQCSIQG